MGPATAEEVVLQYEDQVRLAWTSLRRHSAHARVYLSMEHHWNSQGHPDPLRGTVDAPIDRHPTHDYKWAVVTGGKPSVTHYDTLEAFPHASLLEVHLETGRTHQIRVHMAAIGTPIVGDKLYGPDREIFLRSAAGTLTDWDREQLVIDRHALHSARLVFRSPAADEPTCIESSLPGDLVEAFPQFAG